MMQDNRTIDASHGYEESAAEFRSRRSRSIGVDTVRSWTRSLPERAAVLDLGCGDGVPITQVLIDAGLEVYAVDASPSMIKAFRERFPDVAAECASVMASDLFGRRFTGAVAWGLVFLLSPEDQRGLIAKVAAVLEPAGRFLFTAPRQDCEWRDLITGRQSVSLGADGYRNLLSAAGLRLMNEADDEGDNHYYFAVKS
jgi:SAM-dependent methyltransferase